MKLAILNTTSVTTPGTYEVVKLNPNHARVIATGRDTFDFECPDCGAGKCAYHPPVPPEILSAIGHAATADAATELLGREVPFNRVQFEQEVGQRALVLKLRGRLPEGVTLTRDDMEEVGYDWWLMTRIA